MASNSTPAWPRGSAQATRPGFYGEVRAQQFEAQVNLLIHTQGSHCLDGGAGLAEIADDASVGMVQIDVRQAMKFLAIVAALPARRNRRTAGLFGCAQIRPVLHDRILALG